MSSEMGTSKAAAQLLAALREIEKARGDVEGLRKILQSTEDAWRSQEKLLAEKDARIAELEKRCNTFMQGLDAEEKDCEALHAVNEMLRDEMKDACEDVEALAKAEAKLRAVSDALEECDQYALPAPLDSLLARIRAIVEGK